MSSRGDSPFSPRMALALVVIGALAFLGVLWLIGAGMSDAKANNGGAHAGAKGLTGYAAFSAYLEKRGYAVKQARSLAALRQPGLLVLTPPTETDPRELTQLVQRRRTVGPTLLIMPKWEAYRLPRTQPQVKDGWVAIAGAGAPEWRGFYDDIIVRLGESGSRGKAGWFAGPLRGQLPDPKAVLSARSPSLVPLVEGEDAAHALAAYEADGGDYPGLRKIGLRAEPLRSDGDQEAHGDDFPVIFVFEPDLFNNYGFTSANNARLGETIVSAVLDDANRTITFDLTLNGFGRSRNLLALAFEPLFLAATLCLMLAALVAGWRAFNRFGPPRLAERALAFGKRALVSNAAGLVQRTRRLHLVTAPYADAARERLARALALPARLDAAGIETAIDRALAARAPDSQSFTQTAAVLRNARRPLEILRAARALHALERTLTK